MMKVSDLKKGMILKLADSKKRVWISVGKPWRYNEPELRFIDYFMESLIPARSLPTDSLIFYLGHDHEQINAGDASYKKLVRRIMIDGKIAVVPGANFKYLAPHPEFTQ